jgi:hypothetical protein
VNLVVGCGRESGHCEWSLVDVDVVDVAVVGMKKQQYLAMSLDQDIDILTFSTDVDNYIYPVES